MDGLRRSCRLTTGFSLPEAQQVRQVERLQSALDQAAALGLDVHTESGPAEEDGSEPASRVVGLKLTVKREQIHTQALAEAGLADLAAGIYPVLSDVVHTTPNLLTIMDTGAYPTEQPEVTHIETAVHPETIEAAVMFAILPSLHLAERHAAYLGHRTREVQSYFAHPHAHADLWATATNPPLSAPESVPGHPNRPEPDAIGTASRSAED